MANRYFNNQAFTLSPGVCKLFANVTIAGTGAPTLVTSGFSSKGIVSVTRDNTGLYTFVFGTQAGMLDVYYKLLNIGVMFDTSGASSAAPAAPLWAVVANSVATPGTCSVQIQFYDVSTPSATDPASGESLYFEFTLKNSTAP